MIRDATSTDAHVLSRLAMRAKAHWGYSDEFLKACEAELTVRRDDIENDRFSYFVAEEDSVVVGFCALERSSTGEYELEALFVDPDYIGRGFGSRLFEHAVATVRAEGGKRLLAQSDPHAENFYQAVGARSIGSRESGSISGRFLPLFEFKIGP